MRRSKGDHPLRIVRAAAPYTDQEPAPASTDPAPPHETEEGTRGKTGLAII